jgi:hypothetical protein
MLAYIVLLLAILTRILPPAFHLSGWNFTALGGGLLFFGSRLNSSPSSGHPGSKPTPAWLPGLKLASALAVLMATDYYLTVFAYHYPFRMRAYIVTWVWYAVVCLLGMEVLRKPTALRVVLGVLASATSFFLLSNFVVWAGGALYPRTLAGLAACYTAALPFYRNDLVSTAITAGALFGLPALATKVADIIQAAENDNLPMA